MGSEMCIRDRLIFLAPYAILTDTLLWDRIWSVFMEVILILIAFLASLGIIFFGDDENDDETGNTSL